MAAAVAAAAAKAAAASQAAAAAAAPKRLSFSVSKKVSDASASPVTSAPTGSSSALSDAEEAQLEVQAEEMAAKSLASLVENARAAKMPAVKAGILKRLRAQALLAGKTGHAQQATPSLAAARPIVTAPSVTAPPPSVSTDVDEEIQRPAALQRPPTELPPPQDGIEACGDDPWFADPQIRMALRDAVSVAHADLKIVVGNPADEIARILPRDGHALAAGAVLRLGGQHLGGYGAGDIAYAYRQLSRALHPDKNPGNADATAAFKRLAECQDELKKGLEEVRSALLKLNAPFRGPNAVGGDELERPQEALFAESSRLVAALLALACEGHVPDEARWRLEQCLRIDSSARGGSWARPFKGTPEALLSSWLQTPELLHVLASSPVRTAYDCSAKRYRARFLCTLNRLALLEARRSEGCVRQTWGEVWSTFPEITLWQQLRAGLEQKCRPGGHGNNTTAEDQGRDRSRSPARPGSKRAEREEKQKWSPWARRWRKMIRAVLCSGTMGAVPWSDLELRKLCAAMWRDFADPLSKESETDSEEKQAARRALGLFRTEKRGAADIAAQKGAAPAEWAFVPAADLLLIVGEDLVGMTVEGVFTDGASPERLPFATAIFQTMM